MIELATTWSRIRLERLALLLALPLAAIACSHPSAPAGNTAQNRPGYAAVARGKIAVEGGLLQLNMPIEGTLTAVDVHDGDHVEKGQVLATLDARAAHLAVDSAQAELQQAKAQQLLRQGKLKASRQRAQRLQAAAKAGAGDGQSADDAANDVTALLAESDADDAAVAMARQKIDAARYLLSQHTLKAPIAADVVHVAAQPGASVSPQSPPLFTLLPVTPRVVRAELSESFVDAVKVGMSASVTLDASDRSHPLPAHVLRIGQVVGPSTLADDPEQRANARTVTCVLAFDQPQHLRIGQRVLVQFGAAQPAPSPKGR